MTDYLHRFTVIIPAASKDAFNNYIKNNVDSVGGERTCTIGLSASGSAPATHYWSSIALTNQELLKIAQRLAILAGLSQPSNWDSMTRAQKKQWFLDNRQTII